MGGYITNIFGQVERALTLFATETVTLTTFTAGTKGVTLPKMLTTKSGQLSEKSTAFNEVMWGGVTRQRISQVRTVLRNSSLEKIIQKARDFEKISSNGSKASSMTETKDNRLMKTMPNYKTSLTQNGTKVSLLMIQWVKNCPNVWPLHDVWYMTQYHGIL
jgi:hypothetical protein